MVDIWTGKTTYRKAQANDDLSLVGPSALTKNVSTWMNNSVFSGAETTI
jgi:hypothetical protein